MKKIFLLLITACFAFLNSCQKPPDGPVNVVPIVPTGLTATVFSTTQINLSWTDNSTNETGFKIERKTAGSSYFVIGDIVENLTAYSDNGLTPNTTYTYRVYAYNSVGSSPTYTNEATATTTSVPTLTTSAIDSITLSSAASGGNITSDGGIAITVRGIVWSTSTNPTVFLSTKTIDGNAAGNFKSSITGLTANTTYYVRAYATNIAGTGYGNELSFKTNAVQIPTLITTTVSAITVNKSTSGGNITNDGGGAIAARGVVWSTSTNPTVGLLTKTSDGIGTGIFVSTITGLAENTSYYVRAYATNSEGTGYGGEQRFTTNALTIPSITICNQTWMIKNLDVATYRDGTQIPQITNQAIWDTLTTGAYCYYNNDSATYASIYGKLYNWYAVNDSRGLAPTGWHIPTDEEWNTISNCLGGRSLAGGKMKQIGTTNWLAPNTDATNSSGWTGVPAGMSDSAHSLPFTGINKFGNFWSSSEYNYVNSAVCYILMDENTILVNSYYQKSVGLSVRCIKD